MPGTIKLVPFGKRSPGGSVRLGGEHGLVEVYRCDPAEALVVKSLLQSQGIPAVLRSRIAQSVHPFSIGDQGAVAILVRGKEAPRARRLFVRVTPRAPSA